jgi:hypothetical protein
MHELALSLLVGCGLFQAAMGAYFIALRPAMLAEDERFTGVSLDAMERISSSIPIWLDRVFMVLGGQAIAAGLLITLSAILLWRRTISLTALMLMAAAGGASVMLMSATNFAIHSDFRWLLLLPALTWTGAALLLAVEWIGGDAGAQDAADVDRLQATERTKR